MKKNIALLSSILVSMCLFIACGGNTKDKAENDIVGKWKFVDMKYDMVSPDSVTTAKLNEVFVEQKEMLKSMASNMDMELTSKGKIISNSMGERSYTISGNKMNIKTGENVEEINFGFKGDTLMYEYDITQKMNDMMKLMQIGDNGGAFSMTFEKCISIVYFVREK